MITAVVISKDDANSLFLVPTFSMVPLFDNEEEEEKEESEEERDRGREKGEGEEEMWGKI